MDFKLPVRVVWTPEAHEDYRVLRDKVFAYRGAPGVQSLNANLQSKFALFRKFPHIGMASEKGKGIRKFRLNDAYNIFYEPRPEGLVIHAIIPAWIGDAL